MGVQISVLLPAYNEAPNLAQLVPRTLAVLEDLGLSHEVVVVDDGSTDDTRVVMATLMAEHATVRSVRLRRNYGKSAALSQGIRRVDGEIVVLMDADGQDDPAEIPNLLASLDGGLDLVTGRRATRNDRFVKRTTSRLYNATTAAVTGVPGRDFNSGLKAMRSDVAASLELYGELHRYIPALAHWSGFVVGEVDVVHHPRMHGESKFGRNRFWRGFLDLVTVKFLTTYTARPFHLFGGIGVLLGLAGLGLLGWMLVEKLAGEAIGSRPALLTGILFVVVAVQMLSLGLLGELFVHLRRSAARDVLVDEGP
jgi:glycosyltransferase involved in cell wall biosynthesis